MYSFTNYINKKKNLMVIETKVLLLYLICHVTSRGYAIKYYVGNHIIW